jgi:hypothetical protein
MAESKKSNEVSQAPSHPALVEEDELELVKSDQLIQKDVKDSPDDENLEITKALIEKLKADGEYSEDAIKNLLVKDAIPADSSKSQDENIAPNEVKSRKKRLDKLAKKTSKVTSKKKKGNDRAERRKARKNGENCASEGEGDDAPELKDVALDLENDSLY